MPVIQSGPDQHTLHAAVNDARRAEAEFDNALAWLETAVKGPMDLIGRSLGVR
jgi:8-oxo-dGTP diphosphatase